MSDPLRPIQHILETLVADLAPLSFGPPVAYVYNPLVYALSAHLTYWRRYGGPPKEILLLGMNPGPWGMAQTGIPFGDAGMVRGWLEIDVPVKLPEHVCPKRPVQGFDCTRAEISGQRLWGWARGRFHSPRNFFARFWVANYCPLTFMEAGGRNRTPDKLPQKELAPVLTACDRALVQVVEFLRPRFVIGVGEFAFRQARRALADMDVTVGRITHPSPANPRANSGWSDLIEKQLQTMGVQV